MKKNLEGSNEEGVKTKADFFYGYEHEGKWVKQVEVPFGMIFTSDSDYEEFEEVFYDQDGKESSREKIRTFEITESMIQT